VIVCAVFFGALEAGAAAMQRDAGVPAVAVQVFVALVILGVLAGTHLRVRLRAQRTLARAESA
jgi:simple sugar transport system permease protein